MYDEQILETYDYDEVINDKKPENVVEEKIEEEE